MADHSYNYHINALFWPINLVEYERDLVGPEWSNSKAINHDEVRKINFDEEGYMQGLEPSTTELVD